MGLKLLTLYIAVYGPFLKAFEKEFILLYSGLAATAFPFVFEFVLSLKISLLKIYIVRISDFGGFSYHKS